MQRPFTIVAAAMSLIISSLPAWAQDNVQIASAASSLGTLETVTVTARYRPENAQAVPVSLSVVDANALDSSSTYNISQVAQLVPSLNYNSPNPRNTSFTIR